MNSLRWVYYSIIVFSKKLYLLGAFFREVAGVLFRFCELRTLDQVPVISVQQVPLCLAGLSIVRGRGRDLREWNCV